MIKIIQILKYIRNNRKQIRDALRKKEAEEFENSLPMSRDKFKRLFDYLENEIGNLACKHTYRLTQSFLDQNNVTNSHEVLDWLASEGGYCDCEILAHGPEPFEKYPISKN